MVPPRPDLASAPPAGAQDECGRQDVTEPEGDRCKTTQPLRRGRASDVRGARLRPEGSIYTRARQTDPQTMSRLTQRNLRRHAARSQPDPDDPDAGATEPADQPAGAMPADAGPAADSAN